MLALTRRGERPLVPGFGVTDPAFGGFNAGELIAGLTIYGPPRTITDVPVRWEDESTQVVEVIYE